MFVNMLTLRNQPAKHKTFKQFLEEVKINAIDAYDNQDYQFDELVSKLGLQGTAHRNPLFNVVFAAVDMGGLNAPVEENPEPGELDEYEKFVPKFDLRLAMNNQDNKVFLRLQYSKTLFKETTAKKMTGWFLQVLEQVLKNKDILLKDILLSHQLLVTQSHTLKEYQDTFDF